MDDKPMGCYYYIILLFTNTNFTVFSLVFNVLILYQEYRTKLIFKSRPKSLYRDNTLDERLIVSV